MSDNGRTYWRSLEQLADHPQARMFLDREFPEGATEPPEGLSRRTVLQLLGASLSLAGLSACRRPAEEIVPWVRAPEEVVPGIPEHYATTLGLGSAAYGVVVESHEGRPTKVEGNTLHPSTQGASSVWLQASILDLYDPDRSRTVREGGEARGWDAFLAAWKVLEAAAVEQRGSGLAVLGEPFSSPTLARLREAFRQRFPRGRWVAWEPLGDESVHAGLERACGQALQPVYDTARASVVLSLEADFLLTETDSIRLARGFADGRRVESASDAMSRLYVVESGVSLTGANADHRLRLPSAQVGAFVAALAAELEAAGVAAGAGGLRSAVPPGVGGAWLRVLARDLADHRGSGLILAGRRQPPQVHAAVFALNEALGNVGRTLTFHEPRDAAPSSTADLAELVQAMRAGAVSTLVVLGGNPAYDAPADLGFAEALAKVGTVIHLGRHVDETARLARWHLPRTHELESWGDARAVGGVPSVVQPLIAPLFDGRSAVELAGLLSEGTLRSGHELVRETWKGLLGANEPDLAWRRVLHDGLLADAALPEVRPAFRPDAVAGVAAQAAGEPAGLELDFHPSPTLYDGRYANNGWLQELPDPITKLTWENAALVSPATAARHGLGRGDRVRIGHAGREVEAPIFIVPGQADDVVGLELGYGRQAAGRVGDGRGFSAYALRTAEAPYFARGARLERVAGGAQLATTQDHHATDELAEGERAVRARKLIREASLDEFRGRPSFAEEHELEHPPLRSPWQEHAYDTGHQWGMVIDLNACTGCGACVVACQSENNVPIVGKEQVLLGREMHWIRVDRYFRGPAEEPQVAFQPVPCMHCENAPCEQVCPVAATVHDAEGLNTMVYNRCIGTRYCSNNCPYKVRRFNFFNFTKDTPEIAKMANNPDVTVRSRGVMEKCTYCIQRINAARIEAKLAGRAIRDGDVQPACQQACPTRAIRFGDTRDPDSAVARLKRQPRNYVLLAELNNRPRTSYLAKLRNPHPDLAQEGTA
jgi:molybdopterin-containing oxidoreductase family iron-sulfur binding subunit